jgi:hypothetical protein
MEKSHIYKGKDFLQLFLYKLGITNDKVVTSVQTADGDTNVFPVNIGLHQGLALSPYLFALVIDEVTRDIHGTIPWCMLFADDVVLVDERWEGVNRKLEL